MDPVQEQLDAYNAHDLGRFVACFAPDATFRAADGGEIRGHAAIRERYGPVFATARPHCTLVARMRTGPWTIDEELVAFDGGTRHKRALLAHRVTDGLIDLAVSLWSDTPEEGAWPLTLVSPGGTDR